MVRTTVIIVGQPLQVTRNDPWKPDSEHGNQNTASQGVEHLNMNHLIVLLCHLILM